MLPDASDFLSGPSFQFAIFSFREKREPLSHDGAWPVELGGCKGSLGRVHDSSHVPFTPRIEIHPFPSRFGNRVNCFVALGDSKWDACPDAFTFTFTAKG